MGQVSTLPADLGRFLAPSRTTAMTFFASLIALALGWFAGVGPEPASAASVDPATPVRVMTFNLRYAGGDQGVNAWESRRSLLLETIRDFDPDLLGTQECLAVQARFLQDSLPAYGFTGAGRDDGKLAGEMCAVFWRESAFRKLDEGHFWLSETPEIPGSRSWDAALTRMVTWVRLRSTADSLSTLFFFDTHFDHMGVEARRNSARLLRERIAEIAGSEPVIVTGDFNAPASTAEDGPYGVFFPEGEEASEAAPLVDVYRALHAPASGEATYHAFNGVVEGERIDWILTTPALAPVAAEIVRTNRDGRYPSDHYPVAVVVSMPLRLVPQSSGRRQTLD